MPSVNYEDAGDMPLQTADWTCSACSLAWMNRALGIGIADDEWGAVDYIGQPANINADWGLMDASGRRLAECLCEQGAPSFICWPSYDQALLLADKCGLLLGGIGWNHWVAGRFPSGDDIIIANSAPGWRGVTDTLSRSHWDQLGPFAAVCTLIDYSFPNSEQLVSIAPA